MPSQPGRYVDNAIVKSFRPPMTFGHLPSRHVGSHGDLISECGETARPTTSYAYCPSRLSPTGGETTKSPLLRSGFSGVLLRAR